MTRGRVWEDWERESESVRASERDGHVVVKGMKRSESESTVQRMKEWKQINIQRDVIEKFKRRDNFMQIRYHLHFCIMQKMHCYDCISNTDIKNNFEPRQSCIYFTKRKPRKIDGSVSRGCKLHQLQLCGGVRLPQIMSWYMIINNLMMRHQ